MDKNLIESGIKKRLSLVIRYLEISGREFSRCCGFSETYYATINDGIGADKLNKIIFKFPQISAEWLLTGEGEMLKNNCSGQLSAPVSENGNYKDKYISEMEKNEQLRIEIDKLKTELFEIKKEHAEQASDAKNVAKQTGTYD